MSRPGGTRGEVSAGFAQLQGKATREYSSLQQFQMDRFDLPTMTSRPSSFDQVAGQWFGICSTCPREAVPSRQLIHPDKEQVMAKYGSSAKREVQRAIHRTKRGEQRSGKGGKAKSRKQAIAIGLSKARKKGAKVPPRKKG